MCRCTGGFRCADVQEGFGVQMYRWVLVCRGAGGFWCAEVLEGFGVQRCRRVFVVQRCRRVQAHAWVRVGMSVGVECVFEEGVVGRMCVYVCMFV